MSRLQMKVNGRPVDLDVPESRFLSEVLREDLRLTGTKIGCNEAECGICTVLVDGTPVVSCSYPAFKAMGAEVETIEGLSSDNSHPVQRAWIDAEVPQCGYCQSGQILSAVALLEQNPDPDDAAINQGMNDVLCRCGTYPRIRIAIKQAARLAAAK